VVLLAAPGLRFWHAEESVRAGVPVVSVSDDPGEVRQLLDLDGEATKQGSPSLSGPVWSPGCPVCSRRGRLLRWTSCPRSTWQASARAAGLARGATTRLSASLSRSGATVPGNERSPAQAENLCGSPSRRELTATASTARTPCSSLGRSRAFGSQPPEQRLPAGTASPRGCPCCGPSPRGDGRAGQVEMRGLRGRGSRNRGSRCRRSAGSSGRGRGRRNGSPRGLGPVASRCGGLASLVEAPGEVLADLSERGVRL